MHLSSPPTAHQRTVVAAAHAGFRVTHEGDHVERVLQEVYGATHVALMSAGGFRVVSAFTTSDGVIETPPGR